MKPNDSKQRKRRFWRDRPVILAISVLVLVLGIVGTTLGYLLDQSEPITNTFTAAQAGITVEEDIKNENGVKNDVKIKNTSDFPVYIRARVIVTWKDDTGNVYPQAPAEGTDYTITWTPADSGTTTNWVKHTDGNYYYTVPVAADASTGNLFTECKPLAGKTPEGYHLSVEILADAIQAKPNTAVQEAWGVTISGGSVTAYTTDSTTTSESYAGGRIVE